MTDVKSNQSEFSVGVAVADGLAELVESLLEDLGPTGLKLTGIQPMANLIRRWGKSNKFVTHGLDAAVRTAVRAAGLPAPLREFLTEFSDAYFDRVKILADKPKEEEVKQAVEEGKREASGRLSDFLARFKKSKPSFSAMVLQLDEQEFEELFEAVAYLNASDQKEYEAWNSLKELIASVEELKLIAKSAKGQETVTEKKTEDVIAEADAKKAVYDKAVFAAGATKAVYDKAVVAAGATKAVYDKALAEANAIKAVYDKAIAEANMIKAVHDEAGVAADVKKAVYDKAIAEANMIRAVYDKAVAAANEKKSVYDKAVAAANEKKSAYDKALDGLAQKKTACNAKRMMETLRFLHGRNLNLIDDLKAFAKGEETPQIKKLAETLKEATAAMKKMADTWHDRAEAIQAKRRSR